MKIAEFVAGYHVGGVSDILSPYPYSQGRLIDIANDNIDALLGVVEPLQKLRLFKGTITEIVDATLNHEKKVMAAPAMYNMKGLLVVRGGGMVFVSDEPKSYKINPHDAKTIFNNLLLPFGYSFDQRDKFVLEAVAAVFEDRAIIRSITPEQQK